MPTHLRRKVFENGEKLRALAGVREAENAVLAARQAGEARPSPVLDAINRAGLRCTLQARPSALYRKNNAIKNCAILMKIERVCVYL